MKSLLNSAIEHTLLKPTATTLDVIALVEEAFKYKFGAVCVNPCHVKFVARMLKDTGVLVVATVGFPLGATTTETKVFEAVEAVRNEANEIDMVINIGLLKDWAYDCVTEDIRRVVEAVAPVPVKVILETPLLTEGEIVAACSCAEAAGAKFVKTCTGLKGDVTVEAVSLMKSCIGDKMQIKASGGIKTFKQAMAMIDAGASRIGTSSSVAIVQEYSFGE